MQMSNFYIERIIAHSNEKDDAIVTFKDGLNIIQGFSDTGKTCVVKCIAFVFGSDIVPFDPSTGYAAVTMIVVTPDGNISFRREVGKKQVEVISSVQKIESDTYDVEYKKNQKRPVLNSALLRLIGIEDEHMIVSNRHFEKKRLTWKNLMRMLYIDEDTISRSESVIEPIQYVEKTLFLSALLFIITGRDFSETDAKTKKEIKLARKKAIEEYINGKIVNAKQRREDLHKQLAVLDGISIEKKPAEILRYLEETEAAITQAVNESKELLSSIMQAGEKAAECDVLLSRYEYLESQYKADIKRLSFIVNGEVEINKMPQNTICPFCEGKIAQHSRKFYVEASRAELSRIISQVKGLSETVLDVQKEKATIQTELSALHMKRANVENLISEQLRPRSNELTEALNSYRTYVQLDEEMKLVAQFANDWADDIDKMPDEEKGDTLEYHPKEYFDDTFQTMMNEYAFNILEECKYENLTVARFNIQDFDIVMDGLKKATNHGQGHRAFLNTVVALMFRKYLAEYAKYKPGLLIIDTPLLGLDQGVDDGAPESMRTALFKYFMNHQTEGQMIIVENLEHIPDLDYEQSGANVITFTKGRYKGRYGFLNGVK